MSLRTSIQRQRMTAQKGGRLPAEYQEVEYIETPIGGTYEMFIDTDYVPKVDFRLVIDMIPLDSKDADYFGFASNIYPSFLGNIRFNASNVQTWYRFGQTAYTPASKNSALIGKRITIIAGHELYIDGEFYLNYAVINDWNRNTQSVRIFKGRIYQNMRMYSAQIYEDDAEVVNLVPCYRKSDSVAGVYDIVRDLFLENAGNGEFIIGAEV